MTNSPATVAALKAAKPAKAPKAIKVPKVKVKVSRKALRAAKAFTNAKVAIEAAKARKDRAEVILREALGDAEIGTFDIGGIDLNVVEVMHSSNSSYSAEILKRLYPDAEKAALVRTPYTYLKTI